jgi:hypothetical protein
MGGGRGADAVFGQDGKDVLDGEASTTCFAAARAPAA